MGDFLNSQYYVMFYICFLILRMSLQEALRATDAFGRREEFVLTTDDVLALFSAALLSCMEKGDAETLYL